MLNTYTVSREEAIKRNISVIKRAAKEHNYSITESLDDFLNEGPEDGWMKDALKKYFAPDSEATLSESKHICKELGFNTDNHEICVELEILNSGSLYTSHFGNDLVKCAKKWKLSDKQSQWVVKLSGSQAIPFSVVSHVSYLIQGMTAEYRKSA